jgi:hypothetical protein
VEPLTVRKHIQWGVLQSLAAQDFELATAHHSLRPTQAQLGGGAQGGLSNRAGRVRTAVPSVTTRGSRNAVHLCDAMKSPVPAI